MSWYRAVLPLAGEGAATAPAHTPWIYVLLGWVGGIVAAVIGSWITNKIKIYQDERKSHRDELKQRVLIPLRDGLEKHFRPLVFNLVPVVTVGMGVTTHFDEKAKATEEQIDRGDVLFSPFPSSAVYGPIDPVLLEDAKKNHFPKQMAEVDKFVGRWIAYASECGSWVSKIAREILEKSELAAFPPRNTGPGFQPHVSTFVWRFSSTSVFSSKRHRRFKLTRWSLIG